MVKLADTITKKADQTFLSENGVPSQTYDLIYKTGAPWETGLVQPEVAKICEREKITGRVLDVGCGLGSNTRHIAQFATQILGVDFVNAVIEQAKSISSNDNNNVSYSCLNIFDITSQGYGIFDVIFDSATLHGFSNHERLNYSECLKHVTKIGSTIYILGIGDKETREGGPRRLSDQVIRRVFGGADWHIDYVRDTLYDASIFPGGAKAVVAKILRVEIPEDIR